MCKKKKIHSAAATISLKRKMALSATMTQGLRVIFNASHFLTCWSDCRDVVHNGQGYNGCGRSGVNKNYEGLELKRGGKPARHASIRAAALVGFIKVSRLWTHHSYISFGKLDLHLSRCHFICFSSSKHLRWRKKEKDGSPANCSKAVEVLPQKPAVTFNNQTCMTVHFPSWIRSASAKV